MVVVIFLDLLCELQYASNQLTNMLTCLYLFHLANTVNVFRDLKKHIATVDD